MDLHDLGKKDIQSLEKSHQALRILSLLLSIGETSAPYNELSLALIKKYNLTICTYFKSNIFVPKEICLFEGNGSLKGFFHALNSALKEEDYDIIHAHSPHVGVFLILTMLLRRPKLIQPKIYTVHNSYQNFKLTNKLMLIPVFAFFQKVVCCSQASYDSFPGFFKWLAGERLCTVPNGVDIDRVDRIIGSKRQYFDNSHFTLVTVGRLIEIKNPLSALNAFQKSADLASRLVFIGEGNLRESLLTKSRELGIEKQVELTGLIPREKVYENLAKADLYISTSWGEGLPVATLEAMACGCPVVLSDIPPHREIAEGTDFIPLVQPDDVVGFAQEIKRFRQMSALEQADIGKKCRKLVEDKFSLTAMHQGYEKVYAQVLAIN